MEDNLNYTQKPINFDEMGIPTLDHMDGLDFKPFGTIVYHFTIILCTD